jgi:hypothetical protein
MSPSRSPSQSSSLAHSHWCVVVLHTETPSRPAQSVFESQLQRPVAVLHTPPRSLPLQPVVEQLSRHTPRSQRPDEFWQTVTVPAAPKRFHSPGAVSGSLHVGPAAAGGAQRPAPRTSTQTLPNVQLLSAVQGVSQRPFAGMQSSFVSQTDTGFSQRSVSGLQTNATV